MTTHSLDFYNWLQSELDTRQWSQSDLARASGLSRAVVNKLVNGKTYPRPATIEAIARAFKTPTETAYRIAGLLGKVPEDDEFINEINYKLRQIKNPQRKATALRILDALIEEEETEQRISKK